MSAFSGQPLRLPYAPSGGDRVPTEAEATADYALPGTVANYALRVTTADYAQPGVTADYSLRATTADYMVPGTVANWE